MKTSQTRKIASTLALGAATLASLSSPRQAFAIENIIRPFQSVRSSGMGGTRITTGLYEDNFFGNPARVTANPIWRVTLFDAQFEVGSSAISNIGNITGGGGSDKIITKVGDTAGTNNHIRLMTTMPAFYIPPNAEKERKFGFAAGLISSTQADIAVRRAYELDPQLVVDVGPAVTVGRQFLDNDALSVGVTPHLTYRLSTDPTFSTAGLVQGQSLSPTKIGQEGAHIDIDLGSTYDLPYEWQEFQFTSGASINNAFGGAYRNLKVDLSKQIGNSPRPQDRAFNLGVNAHRKTWGVWHDTLFAFETTDWGNNRGGSVFRTLHIGAESHWKRIAARLGLNQGYIAAGLGFDLKVLQIDLATYGEEMSLNTGGFQDRRYAIKFALQI